MDNERYTRGREQYEKMSGMDVSALLGHLQEIAPDLARFTVEFPYGDVLPRPALDIKSRQIATVAALTALGNAPVYLHAHIYMALNVGCSREEIVEVITQMAVYAGFPAALTAMKVAKDVFEERDQKGLD